MSKPGMWNLREKKLVNKKCTRASIEVIDVAINIVTEFSFTQWL